jgi:hypothetical protein
MVCAERGYKFTCVTDPNFAVASETMMTAYGARVIVVDVRDQNGGYLQARLSFIRKMMAEDHGLVWVNQYANMDNVMAHYSTTGQEILAEFPRPAIVFIGAGTTGTLGGVSTVMRERSPETRIVAIDSAGSITFGGAPGRRYIPGLGTSVAPSLRTSARFDELIMIPEIELLMCAAGWHSEACSLGAQPGQCWPACGAIGVGYQVMLASLQYLQISVTNMRIRSMVRSGCPINSEPDVVSALQRYCRNICRFLFSISPGSGAFAFEAAIAQNA